MLPELNLACVTHAVAVMSALQRIEVGLARHMSQTQQASEMTKRDLQKIQTNLQCPVRWAADDPCLEDLLGPESEEGTASLEW